MHSQTVALIRYALSRLVRYARYWRNTATFVRDSQPLWHL